MSQYTTELRYICEGIAGCDQSVGVDDIDSVISIARPTIFNFDSRNVLANDPDFQHRFLMRYWTREICCDTYGLWKLYLRQALDKDADRWNGLLDTLKEKYNIFENVETFKEGDTRKTVDSSSTNETTQNANSRSGGTSRNKYSETPNGKLSNVENGEYLTSYTYVTDSNEADTSAESKGNNDYAEDNQVFYNEHTKGKTNDKTNTEIMVEYRKSLFDIGEQLIQSLETLFFGLW